MAEYEEDYYAILGVEESAAPEEIRKAYLKLAKKLHPDRFPNDEEGKAAAQAEFRRVTQAHYVLGEPERRTEYDSLRQLARVRMVLKNTDPGTVTMDGTPTPFPGVIPGEEAEESEGIHQKWAAKHLARAEELFQRRRYQEAETAVKEAIRLVPNDPRYHNMLAEIYLERGWRTYAMTEVQASLRIDPKDAQARNLETRIKAISRTQTVQMPGQKLPKPGFFDQLKGLFGGKSGSSYGSSSRDSGKRKS